MTQTLDGNRIGKTTEMETTILQQGLVKITSLRMVIGTTTYPMSDITSVNLTKRAKSRKPFWFVIAGSFLIAWSLIDQTGQFFEFFNIGMALVIVGMALIMAAKPTYAVQIGSAGGNRSILRSADLTFIQRIVDAIHRAIACRG